MVGRAELLEPVLEQELQLALRRQIAQGGRMVADNAQWLPELRFLEPALTRSARLEISERTAGLSVQPESLFAQQRIQEISAEIHRASAALREHLIALVNPESNATPARPQKVAVVPNGARFPVSNR
jgi:hypothetical protein